MANRGIHNDFGGYFDMRIYSGHVPMIALWVILAEIILMIVWAVWLSRED